MGPRRGTSLWVEVKRAQDLRDADSGLFRRGHSDPFCRFGPVSNKNATLPLLSAWSSPACPVASTPVSNNNSSPEWNYSAHFALSDTSEDRTEPETQSLFLRFEVYDFDLRLVRKEELRVEDCLGICVIPGPSFCGWQNLTLPGSDESESSHQASIEVEFGIVQASEGDPSDKVVSGFDGVQPGELFFRRWTIFEVNVLHLPETWHENSEQEKNPVKSLKMEISMAGQVLVSEVPMKIQRHGRLGFGRFQFLDHHHGNSEATEDGTEFHVKLIWGGSNPLSRSTYRKTFSFADIEGEDFETTMKVNNLQNLELEILGWRSSSTLAEHISDRSTTAPHDSPFRFTDVTSRFQTLFAEAKRQAEAKDWSGWNQTPYSELEHYVYMFVGGLFTDHYPGYYAKNLEHVRTQLGLEAEVIDINTEFRVVDNAEIIRNAVLDRALRVPGKRQILIGHSKGGVDIAAALALHDSDMTPHVAGVITMQAPFWGTYIADWVSSQRELSGMVKTLVEKVWGGDTDCVHDLGYSARSAFVREHSYDGTAVPTVCLASFADFSFGEVENLSDATGIGLMKFGADLVMKETGCHNDGLVAQMDAVLPGSDAVRLPDMMHTEPALFIPGSKYDPGPLTQALLQLWVEKRVRAAIGQED